MREGPAYRADLAWIHHRGFGGYADGCAPDLLTLLEPVRDRQGLVLELGCGSGALTRHLAAAGHRVVATDASPAMVDLARAELDGAADIRGLTLPDDPLPTADAIVSVGHVLCYLVDEAAIRRVLAATAAALRPGGILAVDLCDVRWGQVRGRQPPAPLVTDEWAVVTTVSLPDPTRLVRAITTFVHAEDGTWRRDDEEHRNVLLDTAAVPDLLAEHGVDATVGPTFGTHHLPDGLVAVVGRRPPGGVRATGDG